jgi:hypothetical protein
MKEGSGDELGGDVEGEGRHTTREGSTTPSRTQVTTFHHKGGVNPLGGVRV